MTEAAQASPWLTTEQLASRLHTTPSALYKRRFSRKPLPPGIRQGRDLLFHIDDVTAWEADQRAAAR